MFTLLPVLHFEGRIAVTAYAEIRGPVDGHRRLWVVGRRRGMTSLASHNTGFSVSTILPDFLRFCMAANTIWRGDLWGGWLFSLRAGHNQCYAGDKQREHQCDQQTFKSRDHILHSPCFN